LKQPCVYILAKSRRSTLYVGVTSDLIKRVYEHKNELTKGFSAKYNIKKLVYYEFCGTMQDAIIKEKRVKKWKRQFKYNIIEEMNPDWEDLYDRIIK